MAEIYGIDFADPRKIRQRQNKLLQQQLQNSRSGATDPGSVGGHGFGAGLSKIFNHYSGPTQEEQAAEQDQQILGKTMEQLGMSQADARNSQGLPAERSAEFSERLADNMLSAGQYEKAAQFRQKSEEQSAKALAQRQLVMSTDSMLKADKIRDEKREKSDQRFLLKTDPETGRVSLYRNENVNGGESSIRGANTADGIALIGQEITKANELGDMSVRAGTMEDLNTEINGFAAKKGQQGYSNTEQRKMRDSVQVHTETLRGLEPFLALIADDPRALQGSHMDPETGNFKGGAASIFEGIQNFGEKAMRLLEGTDQEGLVKNTDGSTGKITDLIGSQAEKFGLNTSVAQSKVVAVAYAIAKARDPGGRLSDQDVMLAMRSLTGNGGSREIATQFGAALSEARTGVEGVRDRDGDAGIVNKAMYKSFEEAASTYEQSINGVHAAGDTLGLPYVAGTERYRASMAAGRNGYPMGYDNNGNKYGDNTISTPATGTKRGSITRKLPRNPI